MTNVQSEGLNNNYFHQLGASQAYKSKIHTLCTSPISKQLLHPQNLTESTPVGQSIHNLPLKKKKVQVDAYLNLYPLNLPRVTKKSLEDWEPQPEFQIKNKPASTVFDDLRSDNYQTAFSPKCVTLTPRIKIPQVKIELHEGFLDDQKISTSITSPDSPVLACRRPLKLPSIKLSNGNGLLISKTPKAAMPPAKLEDTRREQLYEKLMVLISTSPQRVTLIVNSRTTASLSVSMNFATSYIN